jgi:hypothetical protein
MRTRYVVILGCLLSVVAGTGRAQTVDRTDTLPVSMQAQIGNSAEIQCAGPTLIPFTPVSGPTKMLKCGDSVTIAGARGNSYLVRTENNSTGYMPATFFPTDPCVQTRFRSSQFRKQWLPKVATMSKDEFWEFKNGLYLKTTQDDISAAYKCLSQSMDQEAAAGGMAGFANILNPSFNANVQSTLTPAAKAKLMSMAEALDLQNEALSLLTSAGAAQTFAFGAKQQELLDRYNSLVEKHTNFIGFVEQRLHDLDGAAPPEAQANTSPWRQILDGTLQGVASFTPPKGLVCDTKNEFSLYGDPLQPGYVYLNASPASRTDCQEK